MTRYLTIVLAGWAMCASAQELFGPDRFTFLNVAPFSPGSEAQLAREMVEYRDRTGNDVVLYSMSLHPEGFPAKAKAERLVESYRTLRRELAGSGIRLGILVQATLGHWPRAEGREEGWMRSMTLEGKPKRFCPLDPGCRDYLETVATLLAREKPCFLLYDDDVHASGSFGVECFCERHVAKFNAENGTDHTPESLREAVKAAKPGDATSLAFLGLQRSFVHDMLDAIRAAIDRVDPSIPAGASSPYRERRFAKGHALRLAAKGQPAVLRVDNAIYGQRSLKGFPRCVGHTQALVDYNREIPYLLDESDSWPHNRYSLPATVLDLKLTSGIFCGLKGSKLWFVNAHKNAFPVSRVFTDKLAERKAFYPALVAALKGTEMEGIWIPSVGGVRPWNPNGPDESFYSSSSWAELMVGVFGLPFVCRAEGNGAICALGGAETVEAMSDERLREIFRGRVLVDGAAALVLTRRGLSGLMGVRAELKAEGFGFERDCADGARYPFSINANTPRLTPTADGAKTLTELCFSPFAGSERVDVVAPASVLATNAFGGTVLTTAFFAAGGQGYNFPHTDIRKAWLAKLLRRLGWNDYEVLNDQDVLLLRRQAADGAAILGVFNTGFDPLEKIRLRTPTAPASVETLGNDGQWRAVEFARTADGVDVELSVPSAQAAVLRIRGEVVWFDTGRLLMERYPSKELVVEDNLEALEKGIVPDYAVTNVVLWLERMGRDMSAYRRAHGIVYPVARPLPGDFKVGYMLDLDRGRIPTMEMFRIIIDVLAEAGFDSFQPYLERAFAYAAHPEVWKGVDPVTPAEMKDLDAYAWSKGVRLVPNQNSFGHLAWWFDHPAYKPLAETPNGFAIDHPKMSSKRAAALCPTDPKTLDFLGGLYDELLPCFSHADEINVGCDEVWDLFDKNGRSAARAREVGVPSLYMDHVLNVRKLVRARGKRMAIWGDMVLRYPELLPRVPKDIDFLLWGYSSEYHSPGDQAEYEGRCQAASRLGIPFTVCPSTCTYHYSGTHYDFKRATGNIRQTVEAAGKFGAEGLLLTEWGTGGHPYPFLMAVPSIAYTGLLCRNRPADDAALAREIDRLCKAPIGQSLVDYGRVREAYRDKPDLAKARRALDAALAVKEMPDWVRNGLAVLDLKLRVETARAEKKPLPSNAADEYARLWRAYNREGGLAYSLGQRRYR